RAVHTRNLPENPQAATRSRRPALGSTCAASGRSHRYGRRGACSSGVQGRAGDQARPAYEDPKGFSDLIEKLIEASASYLIRQLGAGVDAVQIFDTCAGVLPTEDRQSLLKGFGIAVERCNVIDEACLVTQQQRPAVTGKMSAEARWAFDQR